jgi:integrase
MTPDYDLIPQQGYPPGSSVTVLPRELFHKGSVLADGFDPGAELNGSSGLNRVQRPGSSRTSDLDEVRTWIRSYADSPETKRSYEKEAERLLRWCYFELGKPVSSMGAADALAYFAFLAKPPPHWVGQARARRSTSDWRPLRGPLKESSVKQAKAIINALFASMVQNKHIEGNPCSMVRSRRSSKPKRIERYVKRIEWDYMLAWLAALPEQTDAQRQDKARRRFLLALVYLTAARRSDVAKGTMGNFVRRDDATWWWHLVGKGQKEDSLPVTDELLDALVAYRTFHNLPPLPSPGEQTPLIIRREGNQHKPLSDNMIYRIVKGMFVSAADDAEATGLIEVAAGLRMVSTHWLRHTSLTHQLEAGIPLTSVRDNARHASIATTSRYLWTEDKERHEQVTTKLRFNT